MSIRFFHHLFILLSIFLFTLPAYANGTHEGRLKPIETHGNIIVSLDTHPSPLALGENEVFLTVLAPNKKYINNASISVNVTMPGMKMKTDNDVVKLAPEGIMRYKGIVNITMGGTWHINVTIDHDGVRDTAVFEEKVKWEL